MYEFLLEAPSEVLNGEEFEVKLVTNDVDRLAGYELDLEYEPADLEWTGFEWGAFPGIRRGPEEKHVGEIRLMQFVIGDAADGVFHLGTFTFRAKQLGGTALDVVDINAFDAGYNQADAQGDSATVDVVNEPPPPPPPGSTYEVVIGEFGSLSDANIVAGVFKDARVKEV